jgi:hypothetical protein
MSLSGEPRKPNESAIAAAPGALRWAKWAGSVLRRLSASRIGCFLMALSVTVIASIGYFWGIQTTHPFSFGDLTPWPSIGFPQGVSLYFQTYRISNLPGQFTVGLGAPNAPTPFLLVQTSLTSIFQSVSVAEVAFYWALLPVSCVTFWVLSSVWTSRSVTKAISAVFYALNPLPILILLPGGNPSEYLWYAILPLIVHGSLRFLQRGSLRYAYEIVLSVAIAGTIVYEYSILSVGFLVLPIGVLFLLEGQSRAALRRFIGLLAVSIASALVTLLLSAPLIAYVSSGFSSTGTSYFSQIQPGFPGPLQLLFYDVPSMGATFYWPYSVNAEGSAIFCLVAIGAWLVILLPLLRKVEGSFSSLSRVPTVLGLLVLFLYFGNWTGLSGPLYATIPAFDLVDWPIKLFPIVSLMIVGDSLLCVDFVIDLSSRPVRQNPPAPAAQVGAIDRPPKLHRPFLTRGSKTLRVILVAGLLIVASYSVVTEWGANLEVGLSNSEPSTYVSGYLPGVATLLDHARQSVGIQNARDLWLPIDGYATMQNSIISLDPNALFFANTLNPTVSSGNGQAGAFAFSNYALNLLITNKTADLGKFLAQEGVAFVVVVTAQVAFHVPYTRWDGVPYFGPPYLASQGWVIGNPQTVLAQVKAQSDLRSEFTSPNATIFFNSDYIGSAWASAVALFSQDPTLYRPSNPTVGELFDLPGEGGTAPSVSVEPEAQISPSSAAILWTPSSGLFPTSENFPTLSLFDSGALSANGGGASRATVGPSGVSLLGSVLQYNQSLPAAVVEGGTPTFNGSTPIFEAGRSVDIPWNVSWALWNETSRSFSLSLWVDTASDSQSNVYQSAFSQGSAYSIFLDPSSRTLYMSVQWEHLSTSFFGFAIQPQRWYLATVTYNGKVLTAYEDSNIIGQVDVSDAVGFRPGFPFAIGENGQYTAQSFNGSISNIRIFSNALNVSEVAGIYNAGPNTALSLPSDPALAYFPLNKSTFVPGSLTIPVGNPKIETVVVLGNGNASVVIGDGSIAPSELEMKDSWAFANLSGVVSNNITLQSWSADLQFVAVASSEAYVPLMEELHPMTAEVRSLTSDSVMVSMPIGTHWLYWSDTYDAAWSLEGGLSAAHFAALTGNLFGPLETSGNESLTVELQYVSTFSPFLAYLLFLPMLLLIAVPYNLKRVRRRIGAFLS